MPIPFATNGQRTDIISATVSGSNRASYPDGFPAITMLDESSGGVPPLGQNFNQILFELASAMRWANVGGLYPYDSEFSTSVGGYPAGARVIGSDNRTIYTSLSDDNTDAPTDGTGTWFNESIGQLPIGVPIPYPSSVVPEGFIACDGSSFPSTYTDLALLYPSLKSPDLRGQFIRGLDSGAGVDNGRVILSSQKASLIPSDDGVGITTAFTVNNGTTTNSGWNFDSINYSPSSAYSSQMTQASVIQDNARSPYSYGAVRPTNVSFKYIMRAY